MRTLVVIPARVGSKGIPRKNLRPFGGQPLITWSIRAARGAAQVSDVLVSTDSPEIAAVAHQVGALVHMRPAELAGDAVTLDPVVYDAVLAYERSHAACDLVLTVQPTSPLLRAGTLDAVIQGLLDDDNLDSILTAVDDTHLAWRVEAGKAVPDYQARVNRQSLPKRMKETGGALATRRRHVTATGRLGPTVGLHELMGVEGIDIDSADDWLFAEASLRRRRIAFITIGTRARGLGHITRVMTLMESMAAHVAKVFCRPEDDLAIARLSDAFFPFEVVPEVDLARALRRFGPDIVIHDELDTHADVIKAERAAGYGVVCFEDRGTGAEHADLVFNALHAADESDPARGRFSGPDAYILRDEFRMSSPAPSRQRVENVLITFGGTDPAGLTERVLRALHGHVDARLTVVAGKGLADFDALERLCDELGRDGSEITLHRDIARMSDVMQTADLAFCSAGRTVYELLHMQVPAIVLAQNDVELRHVFAGPENGCLNLGLGAHASAEAIVAAYHALSLSTPLRSALKRRMAQVDLRCGRDFVVERILGLPPRNPEPTRS